MWEILGITAACVACGLLVVVVVMMCRRQTPGPTPTAAYTNSATDGATVLVMPSKGVVNPAYNGGVNPAMGEQPPVYSTVAEKY